jgi:hypothetical protein
MNLNDFFSKPTRVKEAYTNNYPSSTTPADAAAAVSSGKAIDDPDIMGSLRSAGEPKYDRFKKAVIEPALDFRTGLATGDDDAADTELMAEPNKYMQSWGGKYAAPDTDSSLRAGPGEFVSGGRIWKRVDPADAAGTGAEVNRSSIAPYGWRYVEKGEDPSTYTFIDPKDKAVAAPAAAASRSASAPPALDLTPKSKYKLDLARSQVPVDASGANPNIDDDTRARARAWAAQKNAPGAALAGAMRSSGNPVDTNPASAAPAAVKPVVEPVAVKPAAVSPAAKPAEVPATSLKDLPTEKPTSWKDIAQANGIDNPNRIMPGQVLKIPGRADYVVQPGDTLADIAAGKTKAPKYTPSPGQDPAYVAALEKLKKYPNIGTDAPIPRDMQKALGMGPITTKTYDPFGNEIVKKAGREEILTPAIIKKQNYDPSPAEALAALRANEKAMAAKIAARDAEREANRKKVKEDDIDDQTQVSSIERDSTSDTGGPADQHFSSTSFQHDPNNPANNSYLDRQDHNGVASTTYARNVTPKWMDNLKATAGLPGAKPAAQPPSQYPTQAGQGMNNKPFAAYSTPPGQTEITRESLDRMRFLAGIRKK